MFSCLQKNLVHLFLIRICTNMQKIWTLSQKFIVILGLKNVEIARFCCNLTDKNCRNLLFSNLGSTANLKISFFWYPPEGVEVKKIVISFLLKILFLIFRKTQEVTKLYVYRLKMCDKFLKTSCQIDPSPPTKIGLRHLILICEF